jgi:mRNA interferase RelE/StbE
LTYAVTWELDAVEQATRFLADDSEGLRSLFDAVDALAREPRPPTAFPLGTSGLFRLRAGRHRVVYELDEPSGAVK